MRERVLLVGTDLLPRGDEAIVEGLLLLASGTPSVMHVVHALEPGKVFEVPGWPELRQVGQALERGPDALRRRIEFNAVLNGLPYVHARIYPHVRLGSPVPTLLQACVEFDADILIVGTHGRRGVQPILLGSVAQQLLRQAHCPVLIARTKTYHGLNKTLTSAATDYDSRPH